VAAWPLKWADARDAEAMAQAAGGDRSAPAGETTGD
jgi:hypothetical protein